MSRTDNRGAMAHRGTKVSHKCLGAQGSQISYNFLHIEGKECNINYHPMDNMTALSYLMKMGYQKPGVDCDEQRNLAIPFEEKDKDYCQILTRFNECRQTGKPDKPWIQANGN